MKTLFLAALCALAVGAAVYLLWWTYSFVQDIALLGAFFSFLIAEGSQYV